MGESNTMEVRFAVLSTIDNRFSPIDQFEEWFGEDKRLGYNCCGITARLTDVDMSGMSLIERNQVTEKAIDNFINADPTGIFYKVVGTETITIDENE